MNTQEEVRDAFEKIASKACMVQLFLCLLKKGGLEPWAVVQKN